MSGVDISERVVRMLPASISGRRPSGEAHMTLAFSVDSVPEDSTRLRCVFRALDSGEDGRPVEGSPAWFEVALDLELREGVSPGNVLDHALAEELLSYVWPHTHAILNALCGLLQLAVLPLSLSRVPPARITSPADREDESDG
ncbi:MAG: hypothetical protein LBI33_11840 [Propionibacteriaceae bacterium]|jgi:hypothetical protein|nr:hypothetical protein [Propionibacteriaceae bacterium]